MLTCSQLHKRAERIGSLLQERAKINTGDHVALIFPPGIDLICAFYGCLYVGTYPRLCVYGVLRKDIRNVGVVCFCTQALCQ